MATNKVEIKPGDRVRLLYRERQKVTGTVVQKKFNGLEVQTDQRVWIWTGGGKAPGYFIIPPLESMVLEGDVKGWNELIGGRIANLAQLLEEEENGNTQS